MVGIYCHELILLVLLLGPIYSYIAHSFSARIGAAGAEVAWDRIEELREKRQKMRTEKGCFPSLTVNE